VESETLQSKKIIPLESVRDLHIYGRTLKELFRIAPATFRAFTGSIGLDSEGKDLIDEELYRVSGEGIWRVR
jgi:hypothetical protein